MRIEKERNEQEYQAIVAESLDLSNEDCTDDRDSEDEDSGLDSGFRGWLLASTLTKLWEYIGPVLVDNQKPT